MLKNITAEQVAQTITPRAPKSYKCNYGRVLLVGGNEQFGGAIIMAAEACLNTGAGLITVATNSINNAALHTRIPEAMFIEYHAQELLVPAIKAADIVVIGPGLGTTPFALELVKTCLKLLVEQQTCIIDASALTISAENPALINDCKAQIILTPHQMEWQRLSGVKIAAQTDLQNSTQLAKLSDHATLVLKSERTKVYDQSPTVWQNPLGNPGMATGGMGDTLTGIIAGIVAQFGTTTNTVNAAVYLHSFTGDQIAQQDYVVLPAKLSHLLPQVIQQFSKQNA